MNVGVLGRRRCGVLDHTGIKIMAKKRQVYHDYFVEEEYEAVI